MVGNKELNDLIRSRDAKQATMKNLAAELKEENKRVKSALTEQLRSSLIGRVIRIGKSDMWKNDGLMLIDSFSRFDEVSAGVYNTVVHGPQLLYRDSLDKVVGCRMRYQARADVYGLRVAVLEDGSLIACNGDEFCDRAVFDEAMEKARALSEADKDCQGNKIITAPFGIGNVAFIENGSFAFGRVRELNLETGVFTVALHDEDRTVEKPGKELLAI